VRVVIIHRRRRNGQRGALSDCLVARIRKTMCAAASRRMNQRQEFRSQPPGHRPAQLSARDAPRLKATPFETGAMIQIRYDTDDIVVTIPKDLASADYVQTFLERLRVDAILSQSTATDAQIRDLAEEIDTAWWARNRARFLAPVAADGD
jgi:hypothetical protein